MNRRSLLKISPALTLGPWNLGLDAAASKTNSGSVRAIHDVRTFGASGDGKTLDSPAINRAIKAAASSGGGMLIFPAGTYMSFTIRLQSNVIFTLGNLCTGMPLS